MIVHLPQFLCLTLIGIPPMVLFHPIILFPTLVLELDDLNNEAESAQS